jgi:HSP20 family protein
VSLWRILERGIELDFMEQQHINTMIIKKSIPTMMDVFHPFFNMNLLPEGTVPTASDFRPAASVISEAQSVTLLISLPGLSREEVQVQLDGQVLRVSGTRKNPLEDEEKSKISGEISFGNFSRSFQLAEHLNGAAISAHMEHGMLRIHVPFKEQSVPRQITIA